MASSSPSEEEVQPDAPTEGDDEHAMVLLKNLPSRCTEKDVEGVISSLGFADFVSYVRMPIRKDSRGRLVNRGYVFVFFSDLVACANFAQTASGHTIKGRRSEKVIYAKVTVRV